MKNKILLCFSTGHFAHEEMGDNLFVFGWQDETNKEIYNAGSFFWLKGRWIQLPDPADLIPFLPYNGQFPELTRSEPSVEHLKSSIHNYGKVLWDIDWIIIKALIGSQRWDLNCNCSFVLIRGG